MSPTVTPDLERRRALHAPLRDVLCLVLLPLLLYLAAERYLPTDWYSRVTTFLSFREPIVIHGMGDGSCQEMTASGGPEVIFAAITARGGEDVGQPRPWSLIDFLFSSN
jgi:hypothetical protein